MNRPTKKQLRERGRRLFLDRVGDGENVTSLVLLQLPDSVVDVIAQFAAAAFQLGYDAGWDEALNAALRD